MVQTLAAWFTLTPPIAGQSDKGPFAGLIHGWEPTKQTKSTQQQGKMKTTISLPGMCCQLLNTL